MADLDLTVAIRAYNCEKNLPPILERLLSQKNTKSISWEVIVVDNSSTENIANIVSQYQSDFLKLCPLKYYFEPQQGASFTRSRAMKEAQGELVAFLDDDNIPSYNWVATAYHFGKNHPEVGAYSGKIQGDFEIELPRDFGKIATYLAIIDRGDKSFCYNERKDHILPPGAGIIISKKAWLKSLSKQLFLVGPSGQTLSMKGEDIEVLSYLQNTGWEIWYVPEIKIYHKIPAWRLEKKYLLSLARGAGLTRHHIRMIRLKRWERPIATVAYQINDIMKFLSYLMTNYREVNRNIIKAFELQVLMSIIISPYYILMLRFQNKSR